MSTDTAPETTPGLITISLRECLLVSGRVLRTTGLSRGACYAVRDAVVAAEAAGLSGLRALRDGWDAIRATAGVRPDVTVPPGTGPVTVVGNGMHALVIAPDLLDLAVARAHRAGLVRLEVFEVVVPELLAVLPYLAAEHGIAMSVDIGRRIDGPAVRITAQPAGVGAVLPSYGNGIVHHGTDVEPALWWELFHQGNALLTPDTAISRRHAGRSVFDENGELLGELGEDWSDVAAAVRAP
jgi:hypothetical protein